MNDFSKIIGQAKELEAKIKDSQEKIKNIEATGISELFPEMPVASIFLMKHIKKIRKF